MIYNLDIVKDLSWELLCHWNPIIPNVWSRYSQWALLNFTQNRLNLLIFDIAIFLFSHWFNAKPTGFHDWLFSCVIWWHCICRLTEDQDQALIKHWSRYPQYKSSHLWLKKRGQTSTLYWKTTDVTVTYWVYVECRYTVYIFRYL